MKAPKIDSRPPWLKAHDRLFCKGKRCDCIGCYAYSVGMIDKPKSAQPLKTRINLETLLNDKQPGLF